MNKVLLEIFKANMIKYFLKSIQCYVNFFKIFFQAQQHHSPMIIRAGFVIKSSISSKHFSKDKIFFMVHVTVKISTNCSAVCKLVQIGCAAASDK